MLIFVATLLLFVKSLPHFCGDLYFRFCEIVGAIDLEGFDTRSSLVVSALESRALDSKFHSHSIVPGGFEVMS